MNRGNAVRTLRLRQECGRCARRATPPPLPSQRQAAATEQVLVRADMRDARRSPQGRCLLAHDDGAPPRGSHDETMRSEVQRGGPRRIHPPASSRAGDTCRERAQSEAPDGTWLSAQPIEERGPMLLNSHQGASQDGRTPRTCFLPGHRLQLSWQRRPQPPWTQGQHRRPPRSRAIAACSRSGVAGDAADGRRAPGNFGTASCSRPHPPRLSRAIFGIDSSSTTWCVISRAAAATRIYRSCPLAAA